MGKFQLKSGNAPTFMEMGSSSPLTQKPGYLESLWGAAKNIGRNVKEAFSDPGKSAGDRRASADREQELREFRDKNPEEFKKSARELPKGHVYDPDADAYKRHMDRYMPEKAQSYFAGKKKAKLAEIAANKNKEGESEA